MYGKERQQSNDMKFPAGINMTTELEGSPVLGKIDVLGDTGEGC